MTSAEVFHHDESREKNHRNGENAADYLYDRSLDYSDAVTGMPAQLQRRTQRAGVEAAQRQVAELYVDGQRQIDPGMAEFCEVMLEGAECKALTDAVGRQQDRRRAGGQLSEQERAQVREQKRRLVEINHHLRDLIMNQPAAFTRRQLTNWLTSFTKDSKLAAGHVDGALSEIAIHDALEEMSGSGKVRNLRYGTVDEDLRGGDIVGDYASDQSAPSIRLIVDAKAGKQFPQRTQAADGLHITIGIPTHLFDEHGRVGSNERESVKRMIMLAADGRPQAAA